MNNAFVVDMPVVRHAEEIGYLRHLLGLVQIFDIMFEIRDFDLCCSKDPVDGIYFVKDADAWIFELEFEKSKRRRARSPQFVSLYSLEMFLFSRSERNDFYIPAPDG